MVSRLVRTLSLLILCTVGLSAATLLLPGSGVTLSYDGTEFAVSGLTGATVLSTSPASLLGSVNINAFGSFLSVANLTATQSLLLVLNFDQIVAVGSTLVVPGESVGLVTDPVLDALRGQVSAVFSTGPSSVARLSLIVRAQAPPDDENPPESLPEPLSVVLCGGGLAVLGLLRRRALPRA
ncbi:MAG TPA: hypothetical protein DEH78_05910 [Solibacterales bacterium]|nr:hypothetical protein [Bryobacterales bacterium]